MHLFQVSFRRWLKFFLLAMERMQALITGTMHCKYFQKLNFLV